MADNFININFKSMADLKGVKSVTSEFDRLISLQTKYNNAADPKKQKVYFNDINSR